MSELAKREPHPVMAVLMSEKTESALLALAPDCDAKALMARARLAVVEKPDLGECTPESILMSVKKAAASGFQANSFGRDWHLIPRWNKATRAKEAQFQVDYKGYIHLAKGAGLPFIKAEHVYDRDEFIILTDDKGCHISHSFAPLRDRGEWAGTYSMTKDKRGVVDFEWMTKDEIMAVRALSPASSGPWVSHEGEMAKKTVLRRHSKRWRLSGQAKDAIAADDEAVDLNAPVVRKSRIVLEEPAQIPAAAESPAEQSPDPQPEPDENGEFTWK